MEIGGVVRMRKHGIITTGIVVLLVAAMLGGCAQKPPEPTKPQAPAPSAAPQLKQISIGGAGTAGTFYIMAAGIADLITKKMGINSVAEVTQGSVENAKLIDQKKVEMAVMQVDVAQNAVSGKAPFDKPIEMVAVSPMYPNVVQIITLKNSPIKSFADLRGKRVSVGSPGSGILATNEVILKTLGLSLQDIRPQYLSFAETTNAFRDGTIDAAIVNTAAPAPFVVDLETSHPIKLIALTDEEINKFTQTFPYFVKATIPKDSYKSLEQDVATFAVWITLAARKDLPEDSVYQVVKTIMENQDFLKSVHVVAKYMTPENAASITGLPFHPGAAKFFKEKGITVPTK